MSYFAKCIAAAWLVVGPASYALAQQRPTHVPIPTRLIQIYVDYERRLINAINHSDNQEIDRLIADDFEMRTAAHPGVSTPRADWIAQVLKDAPVSTSIEQMAVHDYGNIRIVSFITKGPAGHRERDIMMVDVWMQSGETSILKTRYAATRASSPPRIPGDALPKSLEKRF